MEKTLPQRSVKDFGAVVVLPALDAAYETMPKVTPAEVLAGLKGKADKGESFIRLIYLVWKGSVNSEQVAKGLTGALRHAIGAAVHTALQGRDQSAPLPGEVVGRAWAAAAQAWAACPSKAPAKGEATAKGEGTAKGEANEANEANEASAAHNPLSGTVSALQGQVEALTASNEAMVALLHAIEGAPTIKAVRALIANHKGERMAA